MSWRKNIFIQDGLYKVKQPFSVVRDASFSFKEGEVLRFKQDYYSHYDRETCYEFVSQADGATKYWALSDEDRDDAWEKYFTHLS